VGFLQIVLACFLLLRFCRSYFAGFCSSSIASINGSLSLLSPLRLVLRVLVGCWKRSVGQDSNFVRFVEKALASHEGLSKPFWSLDVR
jgi:hypothetical protein